MEATAGSFLAKDKTFYKSFIHLLAFVALQNIIAYTVNIADNIMLGMYLEDALAGAAVVNQIFFLIQQFGVSVSNTLVTISSQYWGEGKTRPIRILTGYALKLSAGVGIGLILIGMLIPQLACSIFSPDAEVIRQGTSYMMIVVWSFAMYCISVTLYAALRAVGIVKISFYLSIVTLIVNCGINALLIFGIGPFPELGIVGAATGTLISRAVELAILVLYCKKDQTLGLFQGPLFASDKTLRKDFFRLYLPNMLATVVWGISIPVQTAILGHISKAALSANNVSSTFYQYAKVVTMAMASCSNVMIGNAIGEGKRETVKQAGRTLSVLNFGLGIILALLLFLLRTPFLTLYTGLSNEALALADSMIIIQAVIMVGMSYQMPVSFGIIQGGGDADYTMRLNMICTWAIVMPLTFMAAYWWHVPVLWLVLILQSDQIFKCLPVWLKFKTYTWIRKLTRDV